MKKFSRIFALVLVAVMACSLIPTSAFAASNLDGKKIVCPPEYSILEAAKSVGIEIPTLCYLKDINQI